MSQVEKYPTAPIHILDAIADYASNRTLHGYFVTAVLENNLSEAVFRADKDSLAGLADIVRYVHWEIPDNCHGSRKKVRAWVEEVDK
mgnify:CR=1 FL=1